MSFFGFVLLSKLDVAFILPQNAKTQLPFLAVTFSISILALVHTDGHFSPSLGSIPVFGHTQPDQNIPRKECHPLAIPLTVQSLWLGCLSKEQLYYKHAIKIFRSFGKENNSD